VDLGSYVLGSWLGMLPGTAAYVAAGTYGKQLLEGGGGLEGLSWWQVSRHAELPARLVKVLSRYQHQLLWSCVVRVAFGLGLSRGTTACASHTRPMCWFPFVCCAVLCALCSSPSGYFSVPSPADRRGAGRLWAGRRLHRPPRQPGSGRNGG
jgi:hypothetical protein